MKYDFHISGDSCLGGNNSYKQTFRRAPISILYLRAKSRCYFLIPYDFVVVSNNDYVYIRKWKRIRISNLIVNWGILTITGSQ